MLKKIFASVVLIGLLSGFTFAEDETKLFWEDAIGNLSIGMSEKEVKKILGSPSKRGSEELWGADGEYHQQWKYKRSGISLGMVSEKKGGPKTLESISIESPCTLATNRGVRIGSTEQEVKDAYKAEWNEEDSEIFGGFIVGSIYGGLMFKFKNGRVSGIFFGAAAE